MCKPCLERLPKDLSKIYQLVPKIPCNSYSEKSIKTFSMLQAYNFTKRLHHGFSVEFDEFSQNRHKEQFKLNNSEHIK